MLRLNKKIKNEIFPVTFDDFEEGEGGRGGGGGGGGGGWGAERKGHLIKGNFWFLNIQKSVNPLRGTVSFQNHSPE